MDKETFYIASTSLDHNEMVDPDGIPEYQTIMDLISDSLGYKALVIEKHLDSKTLRNLEELDYDKVHPMYGRILNKYNLTERFFHHEQSLYKVTVQLNDKKKYDDNVNLDDLLKQTKKKIALLLIPYYIQIFTYHASGDDLLVFLFKDLKSTLECMAYYLDEDIWDFMTKRLESNLNIRR